MGFQSEITPAINCLGEARSKAHEANTSVINESAQWISRVRPRPLCFKLMQANATEWHVPSLDPNPRAMYGLSNLSTWVSAYGSAHTNFVFVTVFVSVSVRAVRTAMVTTHSDE